MLRDANGSAYLYFRMPDAASEGTADEVAAAMLNTTEPQLLDVVPGTLAASSAASSFRSRSRIGLPACWRCFPGTRGFNASGLVSRATVSPTASDSGSPIKSWQSCNAATERQQHNEIEGSIELLRTISDVLDIRTVFPRVSHIVAKMLRA